MFEEDSIDDSVRAMAIPFGLCQNLARYVKTLRAMPILIGGYNA
jgi:hypothetical protein